MSPCKAAYSLVLIVVTFWIAPLSASARLDKARALKSSALNLKAPVGSTLESSAELNARIANYLLRRAHLDMTELHESSVVQLMRQVEALQHLLLGHTDASQLLDVLRKLDAAVGGLQDRNTTYPVTRRVALGVIFSKQAELSELWGSEAQRLSNNIMATFFKHLRSSAAHKRLIHFLHVSKAGGTSMCTAAQGSGCTTEDFTMNSNCRVRNFKDTPLWTEASFQDIAKNQLHWPFFARGWAGRPPPGFEVSCEQRQRLMQNSNWTFYANELYLPGGASDPAGATVCRQYVNIMMLRDPVKRMLSNLRHVAAYYRNFQVPMPAGADRMMALAPAVVNNYFIRSLLGEFAFNLPVGDILYGHLELAKLKLQQFDILLLLERGADSDKIMRYGLGWTETMQSVKVNMAKDVAGTELPLDLTDADIAKLAELNTLDSELYRYAQALHNIDVMFYESLERMQAAGTEVLPAATTIRSCGYVGQ